MFLDSHKTNDTHEPSRLWMHIARRTSLDHDPRACNQLLGPEPRIVHVKMVSLEALQLVNLVPISGPVTIVLL